MDEKLAAKLGTLEERLASLGRGGVLVAFSGGVDSSLLLAAAKRSGARAVAVTVSSSLQPAFEVETAREVAAALGAEHRVVELDVLAEPSIRSNPPDRCYHCKRTIMGTLGRLAEAEGLVLVEGSNASDGDDYRPGRLALAELGVASPLAEAELTKADVRALARALGLSNAEAPSLACLASRIPYSEELTLERLVRVERAEELLRTLVEGQVRVRDHGDLARLEVDASERPRLVEGEVGAELVRGLKALGYTYVTIDLQGYRTGAMNEVLLTDRSTR